MKTKALFFLIIFSNNTFPTHAQKLSPDVRAIEGALKSSVLRLTSYINYCGASDTDTSTKEEYLERILEEFDDGATMEVSNVFTGTERVYPVKRYFRNLIYLKEEAKYSKVYFLFSGIRVANLEPRGNNRYIATGEYTQTFQAYRGTKQVYADITVKFSLIYVYVYDSNHFKVKFGNTTVVSTQLLNKG
ncbi:MAG: hypothetical protein IPH12_14150 [Saprospirales bacterium]|nr:hypothetical protein [Saprospirales bacterium]MBK8924083.1 hypothetical protein [Saprospirales bacterium]